MIRYYFIHGDTPRGDDIEYIFRHYADAVRKYDEIQGMPYKALFASDDKAGEYMIAKDFRPELYVGGPLE